MEHSQGGPTTPVSVTGTATVSRRPSFKEVDPIANGLQLTSISPAESRRSSFGRSVRRSSLNQSITPGAGGIFGNGLTPLTTVQDTANDSNGYTTYPDRRPSIIASEAIKKLSALAMTAVSDDSGPDDYAVDDGDDDDDNEMSSNNNTQVTLSTPISGGAVTGVGRVHALRSNSLSGVAARRGKPHRISLPAGTRKEVELPLTPADEVTPGLDASRAINPSVAQAVVAQEKEMEMEEAEARAPASPGTFQHPSDLYANLPPKSPALRRPSVVQAFKASGLTGMTPISQSPAPSPPILFNPKCSGYFVEPVSLMWLASDLG
jgi:hypothetical protein